MRVGQHGTQDEEKILCLFKDNEVLLSCRGKFFLRKRWGGYSRRGIQREGTKQIRRKKRSTVGGEAVCYPNERERFNRHLVNDPRLFQCNETVGR